MHAFIIIPYTHYTEYASDMYPQKSLPSVCETRGTHNIKEVQDAQQELDYNKCVSA